MSFTSNIIHPNLLILTNLINEPTIEEPTIKYPSNNKVQKLIDNPEF